MWITLTCGAALSSLRRRLREVDIDDVVVADPSWAPHGIEEIHAAAHLGGATAQLFQQRELDASRGDCGVVDADLALDRDRSRAGRT